MIPFSGGIATIRQQAGAGVCPDLGKHVQMVQSGAMETRGCALCGRVAPQLTRHHLIPRRLHGRPRTRRSFTRDERLAVILLCRACHKQIHAVFTESELASDYCSIEALAAHPEVARFIEWIARQPATVDVRVSRRRR